MKTFVKSFDEKLDESIAMIDHFNDRVTERIFKAYIKKLEPIKGGLLAEPLTKEAYNDAAKRIKRALGLAIQKVKNSNRLRHTEMNRFCVIQLPHIYVKFGEIVYQPTFSIKNPKIEGSVYYLVGRNTSLKTVLLFKEIEPSNSFLADKMLNNIKRHGDNVDDEELMNYESLNREEVLDRTDFYTAIKSGSNDVTIDMSISDEDLNEHIASQLEHSESVKINHDRPAQSFREIIGRVKELGNIRVSEKQMIVQKGRIMPVTFNEEFRLNEITGGNFLKDPARAIIFSTYGSTAAPFMVTQSDFIPKIERGSLNTLKGMHKPLKIHDKIWIKPSMVTKHDLESGCKLFDMQLDITDMKYAYFYGNVTSVTNSSRDGIIIKIQPTKMIFYKDNRIIESLKYKNK